MTVEQKQCSICRKTKALTDFARSYKKNSTPDMLSFYQSRCKECEKVRLRERDQKRDRTEYYKERNRKRLAEGYYKGQYAKFSPEKKKRIVENKKLNTNIHF